MKIGTGCMKFCKDRAIFEKQYEFETVFREHSNKCFAWVCFFLYSNFLYTNSRETLLSSLPSLCPELTVQYSQYKKNKVQSLLSTILGKKKKAQKILFLSYRYMHKIQKGTHLLSHLFLQSQI